MAKIWSKEGLRKSISDTYQLGITEQLIRNQEVGGSTPLTGSLFNCLKIIHLGCFHLLSVFRFLPRVTISETDLTQKYRPLDIFVETLNAISDL